MLFFDGLFFFLSFFSLAAVGFADESGQIGGDLFEIRERVEMVSSAMLSTHADKLCHKSYSGYSFCRGEAARMFKEMSSTFLYWSWRWSCLQVFVHGFL